MQLEFDNRLDIKNLIRIWKSVWKNVIKLGFKNKFKY